LFQELTLDGWLLFLTRFIRLFAYGTLSAILVLYLTSLGLTEPHTKNGHILVPVGGKGIFVIAPGQSIGVMLELLRKHPMNTTSPQGVDGRIVVA